MLTIGEPGGRVTTLEVEEAMLTAPGSTQISGPSVLPFRLLWRSRSWAGYGVAGLVALVLLVGIMALLR